MVGSGEGGGGVHAGAGVPVTRTVQVVFRTLSSLQSGTSEKGAGLPSDCRARSGNAKSGSSKTSGAAPEFVMMWLPVPYALPAKPYGSGDQPWAVDVPFPGIDALGFDIYNRPLRHYGNVEPGTD